MPNITPITRKIAITIPNEIHSGDVTHHHDHAMLPVNLRTKKIRNRMVPKPKPPLEEDEELISIPVYKEFRPEECKRYLRLATVSF